MHLLAHPRRRKILHIERDRHAALNWVVESDGRRAEHIDQTRAAAAVEGLEGVRVRARHVERPARGCGSSRLAMKISAGAHAAAAAAAAATAGPAARPHKSEMCAKRAIPALHREARGAQSGKVLALARLGARQPRVRLYGRVKRHALRRRHGRSRSIRTRIRGAARRSRGRIRQAHGASVEAHRAAPNREAREQILHQRRAQC